MGTGLEPDSNHCAAAPVSTAQTNHVINMILLAVLLRWSCIIHAKPMTSALLPDEPIWLLNTPNPTTLIRYWVILLLRT